MSDLIIEYKETVDSDCTLPVLTSSKTEGVVLQEEHFGRVQNHDITGYNILPRNYCTYRNRSDGVDFTFNINRCCDKGIISKFYPVFYGNNSDIFFISMVLNYCDEVVREIAYTCTGTGQKVLSFLDLQKMNIRVPSYDEQKKISQYFEQLDNLITLHQRQPFLHSTPEISLTVQLIHPFYTSSWEQRKFSELVQIERGGSPRPIDDFITDAPNGLNWIKIGDAPTQGNYITKTAEKIRPEGLSKTREVHPGDLILSNSMSFGKPYIMGIDGCIHDGWLLIRNTYGVFDLTFLCHLLGTPQMLSQYRSLAAGSTVNNLNKELVGNTVVTIPSITEQRVLGDYLEQLDNLITLHQRKGKAAVTGCSNDANNSKGVYCKARDFGYKCYKKVKSQQIRCLIAVFIFFV